MLCCFDWFHAVRLVAFMVSRLFVTSCWIGSLVVWCFCFVLFLVLLWEWCHSRFVRCLVLFFLILPLVFSACGCVCDVAVLLAVNRARLCGYLPDESPNKLETGYTSSLAGNDSLHFLYI